MLDHEFTLLKIKAAIAPQAESWPRPDNSQTSLGGADGKPHVDATDMHWAVLYDAVADARNRVTQVFAEISAIEVDKSLSPAGKAEKKQKIAKAAIASFAKSKSLSSARDAVEVQVKRWNEDLGVIPTLTTDSIGEAMVEAEIRAHLAAMKPAERMAFIDSHVEEVGNAVLVAPGFLSGLSPAELGVVKQRIEARTNPELAKSKAQTTQALADAEKGWRNAIAQIRERGGIDNPHDGT